MCNDDDGAALIKVTGYTCVWQIKMPAMRKQCACAMWLYMWCVWARRTYMAVYLYICSSWHSPPSLLRWWGRSSPSGISLITAVTSGINNKTAEGFININGTITRVFFLFSAAGHRTDNHNQPCYHLILQKGLAYTMMMSTLVSGPTLPILRNSHHYALPADCSSVRDSARS